MDMKKVYLYLASLILLTGCIADERDSNMVDDSFGITAKSLVQEASVHTGSTIVGLAKNGKGRQSGTLSIVSNLDKVQAALDAYNQKNKTDYKSIAPELVSWSSTSLSYKVDEVVKELTLSWDPDQLAASLQDQTDRVIPILIEGDGQLKVSEGRDFMLIHLNRSSVAVPQTQMSRQIEKKMVEPDAEGYQPSLQETLTLDLNVTNPLKGVGMTFPVAIDNSLIADFNAMQEEDVYVQAPEGLVTLNQSTVTVAEGAVGSTFRLTLDKSKLLNAGVLEEFPSYVIPVRVDKSGLQATLNGEAFDLRGLDYGNLVTYIAITYKPTVAGVTITREWGKYSTADAAWSDYISGYTAGADRNVTLDDEYIYIAETNTTKNLWAISIADPSNYRKLPVGTVADEGIFHLSCPRVITNTDASINGGKDVLAVSNMTEGDPKLYIYANGIENDPSVMSLQTWASRRLGDTFTWWGTLKEGILLFKDFNSAQGTVTFKLAGKTEGNLFLVGRMVAPPVTGAGAYFPFPDNVNKGVSTTRGGEKAWLTESADNLMSLEGATSPTLTELSGYFADTAFRFFDLKGKRYVAYTRQVASTDGRLFILEGTPEQSWEEILQERNVVYHAAIQNDSEQDSLDETPSPRASGNSGMDLDVRIIHGDAYIAVIKQNVGQSLFRISVNN